MRILTIIAVALLVLMLAIIAFLIIDSIQVPPGVLQCSGPQGSKPCMPVSRITVPL